VNVLWLSSEPLAEGALGVTGRVEAVRFLRRAGHDVRVICGGRASERPMAGVPTSFMPTRFVPFLGWLSQWPALVKELERSSAHPDIVVSDIALLPALMWWRRRRGGSSPPRVILDVRTPPVEAGKVRAAAQRMRFAASLRVFGRRADAITSISEGLREHVGRLARVSPARISVWGSGCSWCRSPMTRTPAPAELEALVRDRFVICYQGSMSPGRGLFEAVAAIDLVRERAPDVLLLLVGGGSAVPALRSLVRRRGVAQHVRFQGPVPQDRVLPFLRAADVGIVPLPARWEWHVSSPLKLAEYLCAGLPVILTDIRAHDLVPRDAPFAFRTPSASPDHLASAMLAARDRRAELPALGRRARRWAIARLTWEAQLAPLEETLTSLAPASANGSPRRSPR